MGWPASIWGKIKPIYCAAQTSGMLILLLGLFIFSTPAEAREARKSAGACTTNVNVDARCTTAERRKLHAQFGLPSLEVMHRKASRKAEQGDIIIAIGKFKLAGGLALIFQRDRQGAPWVEIRELSERFQLRPRLPIRAKLPVMVWEDVVAKGKALDVEKYEDFCLGGGSFTIEVIDNAGAIRTRMYDVCGGYPGNAFFSYLAKIALSQIPDCKALFPADYEPAIRQLKTCFALQGQKEVAAELINHLDSSGDARFWRTNGRADASDVQTFFDKETSFSWPGIPLIQNGEDAAEFWTGGWLFPFEFTPEAYHAETNDRVRVEGYVVIEQKVDDGWSERRQGSFTSVFVRHADGKFRMRSFVHSTRSKRMSKK